jgi:histone acetyltransferase (RNA polymerase elongator complex component)
LKPRPFIIPFFLPQWGCPHQCVYCHQERITGTRRPELRRSDFEALVKAGLHSRGLAEGRPVELAFYGGTFTLLPDPEREALLSWAAAYVQEGRVEGIRVSTRPDALAEETVTHLKAAGVKTVELGVQSLNDQALERSGRGHSARHSLRAVERLKNIGLAVGIQLMVGLPGDTPADFRRTVREVSGLRPDLVRIYPTVVFPETVLAHWYAEGRYTPLTPEEALSLCCEAVDLLEKVGIPVIRLGLQHHDRMVPGRDIVAGPYHPAFGDLVRGELFLRRITQDLGGRIFSRQADLELRVAGPDLGFLKGNNQKNLIKLRTNLGISQLRVDVDAALPRGKWILRPAGHSSYPLGRHKK